MSLPYHDGELEVQALAGEFDRAVEVAGAIRGFAPPPVVRFLADQPWVLLGARDGQGAVWASAWHGPPGFLAVPDPATLTIEYHAGPDDPLHELCLGPSSVGVLSIDLARRRRVRINGRSQPTSSGLTVRAEQVYPNCMKYINRRDVTTIADAPPAPPPGRRSRTITPDQARVVTECDTFFLATAHPDGSADVSHRGGLPGFVEVVEVVEDTVLRWPDYVGNAMFNSFGNLYLDARAGLVLVEFATGRLLHLSGRAAVDHDPRAAGRYPGAQRVVTFTVEQVLDRPAALPLRFGPVERSPFSPPVRPVAAAEPKPGA